MFRSVFVSAFLVSATVSFGNEDLVRNLPNVTFDVPFEHYSGYLNGGNEGKWKLFYWLVESMSDPETAPLLVWFNGGPGCSSIGGLLTEYGPFYVERNGTSLFENVFAWNRYFNVLFLETPVGVGFSYDTSDPRAFTVGDDETAEQNFLALSDFFERVHPKFGNRPFFLAGESYAGIYVPTLANRILRGIADDSFPNPDFQGLAIGNGYLNVQNLTNSLVHWYYYHGAIGVSEWKEIREECCQNTEPIEQCDFAKHIEENTTDTWALDDCGRLFVDTLNLPENQNAYNYYLDCYKTDQLKAAKRFHADSGLKRLMQTADHLNYDSTDNQRGFNCWNEFSTKEYLNRKDVQKALNIDSEWMEHPDSKWEVCNDDLNDEYKPKYTDTFELFTEMFTLVRQLKDVLPANFRLLTFNGDIDTVCNFIGNSWHMDNLADQNGFTESRRTSWTFRDQIAGYVQRYSKRLGIGNTLSIDVLTVKGAGHFVSDRSGPALQMITNFVRGQKNYSNDDGIDTRPQPNDLFVSGVACIIDRMARLSRSP